MAQAEPYEVVECQGKGGGELAAAAVAVADEVADVAAVSAAAAAAGN